MLSNITVFPRPKNVLLDGGCVIFHHLTTLDNTYRIRNINKKLVLHAFAAKMIGLCVSLQIALAFGLYVSPWILR